MYRDREVQRKSVPAQFGVGDQKYGRRINRPDLATRKQLERFPCCKLLLWYFLPPFCWFTGVQRSRRHALDIETDGGTDQKMVSYLPSVCYYL